MRQAIALLLASALVLGTAGCASTGTTTAASGGATAESGSSHPLKSWLKAQNRSKKKAMIGALIGAVAGAGTAAVTGRDVWAGAAVGAVAGGVAGFLVGKRQDKLYAGRDKAVEAIGYDPSQGYVIRVEEVRFDPPNLSPGEEAELYVRYLVVGPDPKEDITVQSFMGIKYDEEYVQGNGPSEFLVPHGGGIVETTVPLAIPEKAPVGTYTVEAVLEDPDGRFQNDGSAPIYVS